MIWNSDGRNNFSSYIFLDGKTITFEVLEDGHYIGKVNNTSTQYGTSDSTPEIYISGFCSSYKEAIEFLDDYTDKATGAKKEEPVKVPAKKPAAPKVETPVESSKVNGWEIKSQVNGKDITIELSYEIPTAVIKYTTNGKSVNVSSKIYREPFTVPEGTPLKATAFFNKEKVSEFSKNF